MIIGADGKKRAASVRVCSKNKRTTTIHRPIQHLYPLEIKTGSRQEQDKRAVDDATDSGTNTEQPDDQTPTTERPQRLAAAQARDRMLAQTISGYED